VAGVLISMCTVGALGSAAMGLAFVCSELDSDTLFPDSWRSQTVVRSFSFTVFAMMVAIPAVLALCSGTILMSGWEDDD